MTHLNKIKYCFLFFIASIGYAQEYTFQVNISDPDPIGKQVYLASIYGHYQTIIDSTSINEKGEFLFKFNKNNRLGGIYRIIFNQDPKAAFYNKQPQSFDIIFSATTSNRGGKTRDSSPHISFSTSFNYLLDSMVISGSNENKLYYDYLKKKKLYSKKLDLLEQMLRLYPKNNITDLPTIDDQFYVQIQKQYMQLQKELYAYSNKLIKKYPDAFFTKIVKLEQYPLLEASLTEEEKLDILKKQFFKPSDFQDTMLLYSDALPNKIIAYLGLYRNENYTEEQQTREFIKAANLLLTAVENSTGFTPSPSGSIGVGSYVLKYVTEGFYQIKQDAVLAYIADHFLSKEACGIEDEKLKKILQKTADYKRTALGTTAPEIIFSNEKSLKINNQQRQNEISMLSAIRSEYTLLLFWASWCPHCMNMLPELKKIYDENKSKGLEILAISLDEDILQWSKVIADGNYNWLNYSEFRKWESPTARAYNVHATPVMFLLDKDKKIIAKPETLQQLTKFLK